MKRREERSSAKERSSLSSNRSWIRLFRFLFGSRRGHVDINVGLASEKTTAEHKEDNQNDDHKDHQHSDHSGAAATTITITHEITPPSKVLED
jgi:hypothetical protein